MLLSLPLQLVLVLLRSEGLRFRRTPHQQRLSLSKSNEPAFQTDDASQPGVMALFSFPGLGGVVVGDKLGGLCIQHLDALEGTAKTVSAPFNRHINGVKARPSPIFCLTGDENILFSGAGDRFVSVWKKDVDGWVGADELGPHTGWVRDVLYDSKLGLVHSIGCNCIETWVLSNLGKWDHKGKSKIESSPSEGATLSSDLLCLCDATYPFFLSGGVDGRVHVWDSTAMGSPKYSFAAHEGRVTCMLFSSDSISMLCTCGNDGKVKSWKCHLDKDLFQLDDVYDCKGSRVTCLAKLELTAVSTNYVVCGTNNGVVQLLSTQPMKPVTAFQLVGHPTIHCLCLHHDKNWNLWVGHSNGLSVFPLEDFVDITALR